MSLLQKLPEGMRIEITIYLTDGHTNAAISVGNFSVMPTLNINEPLDVAGLLRSSGLRAGDDITGWRVMTAAEIKKFREEEE